MLDKSDPRLPLLTELRAYAPASVDGPFTWEEDCRKSIEHFVEKHPTCFERTHEAGHITGSAWVVNPARTHAALIFHPKLHLWLQPGGHCDGTPDVRAMAQQEVHEELGVPLEAIKPMLDGIFHVDCHIYPAREKNGKMEEMHIHHDVRYLFELDDSIPFGQQEGELVTEKKWVPLEKLTHSTKPEMRSIQAMAAKTLEIFS